MQKQKDKFMSHTLGRFVAIDTTVYSQEKDSLGVVIAECGHAFIGNDLSIEECCANARLLAAAPELLKVIEEFLTQDAPDYIRSSIWDKARAALEKATRSTE
jgi:hypothetical protein